MKKFLLTILLVFLFIIPVMSSNPTNFDCHQYGYTKVFDCKKWSLDTNECNIEIYMKVNPGNIDFYTKSNENGYKIFLYDIFGRKLMEKNLKGELNFNKDELTNGLYLLEITDGNRVFTRRINL